MGFIDIFLISIGLAADSFAVSVCKGLGMKRLNMKQAVVIGIFFGGFQALMPLIGWALCRNFEEYVTPVDHWIAFILLAFIGGKMIWEAFHEDEEEVEPKDAKLDYKELTMLGIATSIDALAVGITFAFLDVNIWTSIALIGVTSFVLSIIGVAIGHAFGARYEKPASIIGGTILILLGVKILLEHLGILVL